MAIFHEVTMVLGKTQQGHNNALRIKHSAQFQRAEHGEALFA